MKSIYDFVNLYNEIGFNCVVAEDKREEYKEEEEKENETK